MDDLMVLDTSNYKGFKTALDQELTRTTEGFVRIGYLLKVARDTQVLTDSGYKSVAEFAKAEYSLSKDQVSRFIAINDRFSENGYSDQLVSKYEGFGVAKLSEMLTLPAAVADELTPDMTRSEIQEVKKEVKEEESISDLEVMMEQKEENINDKPMPYQAMYLFWHERPRAYRNMYKLATYEDVQKNDALDIIAPNYALIAFARISGVGKIMINIKGDKDIVSFTNIRQGDEVECNISGIVDMFKETFQPCIAIAPEDAWRNTYKSDFPDLIEDRDEKQQKTESKISKIEAVVKKKTPEKKQEVAPVQQENKFELVHDQHEDTQKHEEKPEAVLNTECESASTTETSTSDNKRIVFEEIKTAAAKMGECLDRFDIAGAGRYLKDVNDMYNSLAADKDENIPGQMSIEDTAGGTADGREDS